MVSFLIRSVALCGALLVLPFLIGDYWSFQLGLYFLYAIAALGIGICWGQAGFISIGHAAFVGLSAYLSGFTLIHFIHSWVWIFLLPLVIVTTGLITYFIGFLVFHGRTESGPYFALITLALSLLAYQIATSWYNVTGGFNGLKGIPGLPLMDDFRNVYYISAGALVVSIGLCGWLIHAPIGVLWRGLSQNERRVAFFGFDTAKLKAIAFGVSGILAGIAGALYAPQQSIVSPELCGFILSTDLVIWAAVGGRASLFGPVLGTILIGPLAAELRDRIDWWEIVVACIFIIVVRYFPNGLAGFFQHFKGFTYLGKRPADSISAPSRKLPETKPILKVDEVKSRIGGVQVLNDLSFSMNRPGILCIIGPNGAGKTSIFNMLTGVLPAQHGQVYLDEERVTGLPPYQMALKGLGRKFQIPSVFLDLSVGDNLQIALWCGRTTTLSLLRPSLRRWNSPLLDELKQRFAFLRDQTRVANELSHGQRQILELAMALISESRLLLLDEPCAGLSTEESAQVIDLIRWASKKLTVQIIIIEHDMSLVKELADHIFVLHQGRLLAEGNVAEIRANSQVQKVYVGVTK